MKKLILIIGILFAMQTQTALMAQVTTRNVIFNANLGSTLNLTVVTGPIQTINFLTAVDYNNGVIEPAGINPGFTDITIEATQDWDLNIRCPNFTGTGGTIPIDNLGVYCVATGTHQFGVEVTTTCAIAANALGLDPADQELIGDLGVSMGDATDNAFRLHWEMGTMQGGNVVNPMRATSMFDQIANGDFGLGADYTTTAILTLIGL